MKLQRCRPMMGTYVEIKIDESTSCKCLETAINSAYAAIDKVSLLMSFHRNESDLSKMNALAHQQNVKIDALTFELLRLATHLFRHTNGSFDCSVGQHLQNQHLLPQHVEMLKIVTKSASEQKFNLGNMTLSQPNRVRYTAPLTLDLGGIAKGFAVDRACESLIASGIESGSVNAGGDLRVFGQHETAIHIRNPECPDQLIHAGQLSNGAIATSGIYFTDPDSMLTPRSALIAPQTGQPIFINKSFTVIAKTCAVADGLTKALAVDQNPAAEYFQQFEAHALIL